MEAFGPFETRPTLAVGVSGGADSLALLSLMTHWTRERGGRTVALTVDHRLRAAAAAEARQVAAWATSMGAEHHVLVWSDAASGAALQARARKARYRLLTDWCARAGVLHLAMAHHQRDQAETVLMRQVHRSGADGLAGIPALRETAETRLIRPLLGFPSARLRATLGTLGQKWIEDPSNRDPTFERVRTRRALITAGDAQISSIAATAFLSGRRRAHRDEAIADFLARTIVWHPAGWCRLDWPLLTQSDGAQSDGDFALRILSRVLQTVGGHDYPPKRKSVARMYQILQERPGRRHTLGGCLLWRRADRLVVCREPAAARDVFSVESAQNHLWDSRFRLGLSRSHTEIGRMFIARLGENGRIRARDRLAGAGLDGLPPPVLAALPALWHLDEIVSLPHLIYNEQKPATDGNVRFSAVFWSDRSVAGPVFAPAQSFVAG